MAIRRCLAVIFCAVLSLLSPPVVAVSLGELRVESSLDQPLFARIDVIATSPSDLEGLSVNLASAEEFDRAGLTRPEWFKRLQFRVVTDPESARTQIEIRSNRSITEAELALVIEVAGKRGWLFQTVEIRLQASPQTAATEALDTDITIEYELDPYYSNIGAFIPLTDEPMAEVDLEDEEIIYQDLLAKAFTPSFFLVEISVNPLPVLGVYLRDEQEDAFDAGEVSDDVNLIQALTEGFEEPYALSFFVGNVIRFVSSKDRVFRAVNKGFSGFLVSFGDQHIKDSELFDDDWYEVEWKIKGDRRIDDVYHSWSFRIGSKIHSNSDIADTNYIGIRRELFNDRPGSYRWNENIGIDYSIYFSRSSGDVVQHQIYAEKKWPTKSREYSLGIGLNRNIDRYTGELADPDDDLKLIIRPGISF